MKVLAVLTALACTFLYVKAQNVVCGKGTTSKSVTINDGDSYSFKTQKGKKYKGNTACTVDYTMGESCAKMQFVCTKFNTNNKDKKKCKKGDKVTVTANGKSKAYCKTTKPKVTSSGDMSVVFTSDKKKHSSGAVCKVRCTEAASSGGTTTVAGILVTGGNGWQSETSTELFLPHTGSTCSLASLPSKRWSHTLDTLGNTPVLCGGPDAATATSCLQFSPTSGSGVWTNYATTTMPRYHHSSWLSPAGLVLAGGDLSPTTSEIVNGGANFSLVQSSRSSCAINHKTYIDDQYQDSTIITGGWNTQKVVARYTLKGHVENLPEMSQGRSWHGCGSFLGEFGLVLVVAGGTTGSGDLTTTETHTIGSPGWRTGQPLPRTLYGMAYVSLSTSVLFFGGHDDNYGQPRAEVLSFDGTSWAQVGLLQTARFFTAATKMMIDTTGPLDITGCI